MRWIGRIKVNMRIYLDAIDVAPQSAVASVVLFSNWEISWLPETLGPGQLVNKHFRQYVSKGLVFVKKCWVFILQMFLSCLKNKSERMRQSYWKACSQNAESLLERFFFSLIELAYLSESHIHHRANHAWKIYMGCSERDVCIVICEVGWCVWLNPSVGNKESPWREEANVEQILGELHLKSPLQRLPSISFPPVGAAVEARSWQQTPPPPKRTQEQMKRNYCRLFFATTLRLTNWR